MPEDGGGGYSQPLISVTGHPLTSAEIHNGLRLSILASCSGVFWFTVLFNFPWTMFLKEIGASTQTMGWIVALPQLAMMVQVPATLWSEHLARRKTFWGLVTMPQRPLLLLPLAVALWAGAGTITVTVTLVTMAVCFVLGNIGAPAWWSWMSELVPPAERGRFWGNRHAWVLAVQLASFVIIGALLDAFAASGFGCFIVVFGLAAVLGTLDIALFLRVPEPLYRPGVIDPSIGRRILTPLADRNFRRLTLALAVWALATSMVAFYWPLHLKAQFQVSFTHMSLLGMAGAAGAALTGLPWGRILDRIGQRRAVAISMFLTPLSAAVWFFLPEGSCSPAERLGLRFLGAWWSQPMPEAIWVLVPFFLVGGGLGTGVILGHYGLSAALTPRQGRAMAMAVFWTCLGLGASLGPVFAGWLVDSMTLHPALAALPGGRPIDPMMVLAVIQALLAWLLAIPLLTSVHLPPHRPSQAMVRPDP